MPQQINLRTPILLTQKRYFSATTMALSLGVIALVGGALCALWVWSLQSNSAELSRTLSGYAEERERLQAAIKEHRASLQSADPGLQQSLQARQTQLQQREQMLAELSRGLIRNGLGHAARLRLVAQTIPADVWVTEVQADESQMVVQGFTLDPAALNEWVARLGAHPQLQGQALAAIKVERVQAELPAAAASSSAAAQGRSRPSWAFTLVSSGTASHASGAGGRP